MLKPLHVGEFIQLLNLFLIQDTRPSLRKGSIIKLRLPAYFSKQCKSKERNAVLKSCTYLETGKSHSFVKEKKNYNQVGFVSCYNKKGQDWKTEEM